MNNFPLRLPPDVEAAIRQLATEHDRTINKEIVQACKAWIQAERKTTMTQVFEFSYEISKGEKVIEGSMKVEGANEQHARESALDLLEQEFGDEKSILLSLEVEK